MRSPYYKRVPRAKWLCTEPWCQRYMRRLRYMPSCAGTRSGLQFHADKVPTPFLCWIYIIVGLLGSLWRFGMVCLLVPCLPWHCQSNGCRERQSCKLAAVPTSLVSEHPADKQQLTSCLMPRCGQAACVSVVFLSLGCSVGGCLLCSNAGGGGVSCCILAETTQHISGDDVRNSFNP